MSEPRSRDDAARMASGAVAAAVNRMSQTLADNSATMRIESGEHSAELPLVYAGPATVTAHAIQRLEEAKRRLKAVARMSFCCEASEKQATSAAKKEVKRWEQFVADAELLRTIGQQTSFLDDEDGEDEDDE